MYEKIHKWIDVAERIISLIRPKTYNTIAKIVVYTGIGLIIESQVNFVHALITALFEEYIGKSEILRSVLNVSSDSTVGVLLVITGMAYHLVVTLGKDFIDTKRAGLPKYPIFEFSFCTKTTKNRLVGEVYLDGPNYTFEQLQDIPEYEEPKVEPSEKKCEPEQAFRMLANQSMSMYTTGLRPYQVIVNKNIYSQRAKLLEEWLGYEPLKLRLSNYGEILASGVEVQLAIPKNEDVSIKESSTRLPERPKKKRSSNEISVRPLLNNARSLVSHMSKVRLTEKESYYNIIWDVESLQAGVVTTAGKYLIFKVTKPVEVTCTVFCNELTRPENLTLTLYPAKESKSLMLDDIVDDDQFEKLYSKIAETFNDKL